MYFNPLQKVFQTPALSTTTNGVSGMASEIHSTANVFRRYFEYISKKLSKQRKYYVRTLDYPKKQKSWNIKNPS